MTHPNTHHPSQLTQGHAPAHVPAQKRHSYETAVHRKQRRDHEKAASRESRRASLFLRRQGRKEASTVIVLDKKKLLLISWIGALIMIGSVVLAIQLSYNSAVEADLRRFVSTPAGAADLPILGLHQELWYDSAHTIVKVEVSRVNVSEEAVNPISYIWNLGNGSKAEGKMIFGVYQKGGEVQIEVDAIDARGTLVGEGYWNVQIPDTPLPSPTESSDPSELMTEPIAWGERSPLRRLYLAIPYVGSVMAIEGRIESYSGFVPQDEAFREIGQSGGFTIMQALKDGYFQLDTSTGRSYNVFVSPIPSRHVERADRDWYLTQFNTITTSNCGPSVAAMSIRWARGLDVKVIDARDLMGWEGDGAVNMNQMQRVLTYFGVTSKIFTLQSPEEIFDILERDRLVAVSYNMAGITEVENPGQNLLGQYYTDYGGHYLAIKGFSLDRKYFIVYDPIPSDWGTNQGRYGDGMSMYGRNRYYPVDELWAALRSRLALEIDR